jgi:hypothetical protein
LAEIGDILSRLEKIFTDVKLKYVIVGGIVVIHYGHVRATQDIDLIIEDEPLKISQFLSLLRAYEFDVMEDQFYRGYQEKTNVSIFDNKSFMRLDIKVADMEREKDVLNNAIQGKLLGHDLYIASLEYVLLGKILYMGKIDKIIDSELLEYQDIFDFLTLYHTNKEKINLDFLKNKVKETGLKSTLDRLMSIKL